MPTLNETLADVRTNDEAFFKEAFTDPITRQTCALPPTIKQAATRICRAYGIRGICDPMYIANVIAFELGMGDGRSNFKMEGK